MHTNTHARAHMHLHRGRFFRADVSEATSIEELQKQAAQLAAVEPKCISMIDASDVVLDAGATAASSRLFERQRGLKITIDKSCAASLPGRQGRGQAHKGNRGQHISQGEVSHVASHLASGAVALVPPDSQEIDFNESRRLRSGR